VVDKLKLSFKNKKKLGTAREYLCAFLQETRA